MWKEMILVIIMLTSIIESRMYCNWNDCNGEEQGGDWCNESQQRCIACVGTVCYDDTDNGSDGSDGGSSTNTLKATHFWDCAGGACDAETLSPWDFSKYRYSTNYAPIDPNDHGGPSAHGEKMWMTGAASVDLSKLLGEDDGCCGDGQGHGGCGKCVMVTNPTAVNSDWKVIVMKKNLCPPESTGCGIGNVHLDFAVPGYDNLAYSLANICGDSDTILTKDQSDVCGSWWTKGSSTIEGCSCDSLPSDTVAQQRLKKGCELFTAWGWRSGDPTLNYELVECPSAFKEIISNSFDASGPVNDQSAADSDGTDGSDGGSSTNTLKATHFWDCAGGACDAETLSPWDFSKYRYSTNYAPIDPNDHGGPSAHGEKMWMTGAASVDLSKLLGEDDGCCGDGQGHGGCGKCVMVTNPTAVNSDWKVIVMKKNLCPPESTGCGIGNVHLDFAVPGYDNLAYSLANICGDSDTILTKDQSDVCGSWWTKGSSTIEGCSCDSLPSDTVAQQRLKKGCELFTAWGWRSGDPTLNYELVECPSAFKEIISNSFDASGPVNDQSAADSDGTDGSDGGSSTNTLKATHFWDCAGGACDAETLSPWDFSKYRYSTNYAPIDPNDHGGPSAHGEKMWMTGAASVDLSKLLGEDDGCCGDGQGHGGCGKCVMVTNPTAVNSDWKVIVMKKNLCPPESTGCGIGNVHLDFAVPGYDNLAYSLANICGDSDTILTKDQSDVCGSWWTKGSSTIEGCSCDSLPSDTVAQQRLKKGCELFTAWGWRSGDPTLNYELVECPSAFKEIISNSFDASGPVNDQSAADSDGTDGSDGGSSTNTLKATHFWDCAGGACDAETLSPWDFSKYRYSTNYAPIDPNDHGGPSAHGEKMWMTGAASVDLSKLLGEDDGCCGDGQGHGGCGKCVMVTNPTAVNSDWKVIVMKKNLCPPESTGCGIGNVHLDFAVPGYDNLAYSLANICGDSDTILTKDQSDVCGSWWTKGSSTIEGCSCDSLPSDTVAQQRLKKGCELFTAWGWRSGDPTLNYELVECPSAFKEIISNSFDASGPVNDQSAADSDGTDGSDGGSSTNTLKATHFWDCVGSFCDQDTLCPWNYRKFRMSTNYAPMDPNDHGGPLYGQKLWMTGAASEALSALLGADDGCCGNSYDFGGCGKCVMVTNPTAVNSDWKVIVMKKGQCSPFSRTCQNSDIQLNFAVPGYDDLQLSPSNICGQSYTILTKDQSDVCGNWWTKGSSTIQGCSCDSLPSDTVAQQKLKKGCELFTAWGWTSGNPTLNYELVECPSAFRQIISESFDKHGPVFDSQLDIISEDSFYCNWNSCNGKPQGASWCNLNELECERCGGTVCFMNQ